MSEKKKKLSNDNGTFSSKVFFINYAIFVGLLTAVFLILVYTIKVSRESWNNNLKVLCEKVLDEKEPGLWSVGSSIDLKNSVKLRTSCYAGRNRNTGEMCYVVVTRVPTYYGPMSAVFTSTLNGDVEFKGYATLHGPIQHQIAQSKTDRRIELVKERIPGFIGIEKGGNND